MPKPMKDFQKYRFVPASRADQSRLEYPDGTVYTLREAALIAIGGDTVDIEQIDTVKKEFDGEIESVRLSRPRRLPETKLKKDFLDRLGESLPEGGKND